MTVTRKPMFMLGGNYVNPKSLVESIDRNIPYILLGTKKISNSTKPVTLQEAFENVIDYCNELRVREIKEGIKFD